MIHPYWDMALLRVSGLAAGYRPLTLSTISPDELVDHDVVVVGYPARDVRNDPVVQDAVFEGVYNVKRLQPGRIGKRTPLHSFDYQVSAMMHDSSTLGGNCGSAVIDIASGQVIGLHFAGDYLRANYAVPSYKLARDARVADTPLNFSGAIAPTDEWDDAWRATGEDQALPVRGRVAKHAPASVPVPPAASSVDGRISLAAKGGSGSVEIPITVRISVDPGNGAQAASAGYFSGAGRSEAGAMQGRISMRQLQENDARPDY